MNLSLERQERMVLAAALSLAVSLVTWSLLASPVPRMAGPEGGRRPARLESRLSLDLAPLAPSSLWTRSRGGLDGRTWDLFTAPQTVPSQREQALLPTPPPADASAPERAFGLQLLAVERVPYRLQLLGQVGTGSRRRGIFENVQTGEIALASAGEAFEELDILVQELKVGSVASAGEPAQTRIPIGTAVIRDRRSGQRVVLCDHEPFLTSELRAVLRPLAGKEPCAAACEGELVSCSNEIYRIDKIQLAPPAVAVTKLSAGELVAETRTLVVGSDSIAVPSRTD